MPRTKALNHYPSRYLEMVRECAIEGKRVEARFPDVEHALSLRGHWYAFIGALKAEAAILSSKAGLKTGGELDTIELAKQCAAVMCTVEARSTGHIVVWQSRENSWQAHALRAATVTQASSQPASTQLDAIAARLMDTQKEIEDGQNEDR